MNPAARRFLYFRRDAGAVPFFIGERKEYVKGTGPKGKYGRRISTIAHGAPQSITNALFLAIVSHL
jgi:hypothetical protein